MKAGRIRVLALMAADLLCLYGSGLVALLGYRAAGFGHYKFGLEFYFKLWPAVLAYIAINVLFRLYHGRVFCPAAPVHPVEEFRRLVASAFITHIGVIAYLALAYQSTEHYSRAAIVISGMLTAVLTQPVRDLVRGLLHRFNATRIPVLLTGDGERVARVAAALDRDCHSGFRVVGTLPGNSREIASEARARGVRILVACQDPRLFQRQMAELVQTFDQIEYLPSDVAFPVFGAQSVSFDGVCGLEMVNQRRMRALRHEKWVLDKLFSLLAFVLLSPFFLVVPLLIKLTSRGPVFYRQERLGKRGRPIRVWKFRSMYADADERLKAILSSDPAKRAEWEANFKLADDPRVTPLGRFLRKTSIDEFPQLFNVLAGDMALVGPRPIVAKEVPFYGEAYETFSSVRPGVTGLWQASGRSDTDYARRVALDVQYVLNWSPWMDLWILFRTVSAVVLMRGAR